jgi:oxygen-independent coproporphyrinogen-3 oxidase
VVVDTPLLVKYGGNGPRYTSYPTADRFVDSFDAESYAGWLGRGSIGGTGRSLGLYVHVPFCDTLCFYCACNKIATKDREKARKYTGYVLREAELVSRSLEGERRVTKMHWGGGTPTFLSEEDSARLVARLRELFTFEADGEYAIEIDPRRAGPDRIASLARLGFNRLSIGVQDFAPEVQRAVNRIQSIESTRAVIDAGRANGFRSINMDLILGLPKQTLLGFGETLERVIECDPDRIALYSYAHLPSMFKPQQRIVEADLPAPEVKLELMRTAIARLCEAGYVHIGMDHFAKPGDELAVAQRQGRLTRDFQGYSSGGECDLVGLGVSAIGKVGPHLCPEREDARQVLRGARRRQAAGVARPGAQARRPHPARGDPVARVPLLARQGVDRARVPGRLRQLFRDRARRPRAPRRRRPGRAGGGLDPRDAARTPAGAGRLHGVRPLPPRRGTARALFPRDVTSAFAAAGAGVYPASIP